MDIKDTKLKELKNKIDTLELFQKNEIFKIIKKNDTKYSSNKNGIFLNMKMLCDTTLNEIETYLVFIKNKN